MNTISLDDIPLLWRADSLAPLQPDAVSTGYETLDRALGGGWPRPALIEVLLDEHGIGELRMLLALLRHTSEKIVLWLSPPFQLHAIALKQYGLRTNDHWVCSVSQPADLTWAMTHALRSGACHTVIAWVGHLKTVRLQSLKLAALSGGSVGVLFRPKSCARIASPATLRLALKPQGHELEVSMIKMQGGRPSVVRIAPGEADQPRSTR